MKKKIKIILTSLVGQWLFQILFWLNKIEVKGEKNLLNLINSNKPVMVCVWHGRLVFPSWYLRQKTTNLHAIAGRHTDAEIMARILQRWGYGLIRGSTRKGGKTVVKKNGRTCCRCLRKRAAARQKTTSARISGL